MSEAEYMAIRYLRHASFGGHTYKRSFIQQLGRLPETEELSPRQRWYLWQVAWFFRKQLPPGVVENAECNIIGAAPKPARWKPREERGKSARPTRVAAPAPPAQEPSMPLFTEAVHG